MKKLVKILLCTILSVFTALSFAACSETGGAGTKATAWGEGHGGTIIEVTVVLASDGTAKKVHFDEIFTVVDTAKVSAAVDGETTLVPGSRGSSNYYNYICVDDEFFELVLKDDGTFGTYKSVLGTDGKTSDLVKYSQTASEGLDWYYNCVINNKTFLAKKDGDTYTKKGAMIGVNGSVRKRYSSYWRSGIGQFSGNGWQGNMDQLEMYLLTYGFDDLDPTSAKIPEGSKYVHINGVATGATLSADTPKYLAVAKAAYDKAMNA